MSVVRLGLVLSRPMPESALLAALRQERNVRIVFECYDWRKLPKHRDLEQPPTVVLTDMDAAPTATVLLHTMKSRFPAVPVVVWDRKGDRVQAQRARNAGAAAVLTNRSRPERFVARIVSIGSRGVYDRQRTATRLYGKLTPREWDILPYLAGRFNAREIAEDLTLSYATVRTHIRNIYAKCGVDNRIEAARIAQALLDDAKKGYNRVKEVSEEDELRRRHRRTDAES